jgi:argininosuccinate lyase
VPLCKGILATVRRIRIKSSARDASNLIRGRFARGRLPEVEAFTASLPFERRLFRHDIRGSIAHARMLAKVRLIRALEARAIERGLKEI